MAVVGLTLGKTSPASSTTSETILALALGLKGHLCFRLVSTHL